MIELEAADTLAAGTQKSMAASSKIQKNIKEYEFFLLAILAILS